VDRIAGTLVLVALLVASCGGEPPTGQAPTAPPTAQSPQGASEAASFEPVRFQADDGTSLIGRVWGNGDVGVILAHGFSEFTGQDDWDSFQPILADQGYTVLTFNFRGFCSSDGCSGEVQKELGNNWKDVIAAIDFLEGRGVEEVFLVGASMGGIAVLRAAQQPEVEVAGVVSLSTPQFPSKYYINEPQANDATLPRLRAIDEPKLFVAGSGDSQSAGGEVVKFADEATSMHEVAAEPKDLFIVDSVYHSSELVTVAEDSVVQETREAVLDFLASNAGA
jgi:pimeloyl-ACP methyl ester carboxylesterase